MFIMVTLHLDLCSFMDTSVLIWIYNNYFYGCHVQPADILNGTQIYTRTYVYVRIRGRVTELQSRGPVVAQYARFLNSGTTAALTIPIYYKYID